MYEKAKQEHLEKMSQASSYYSGLKAVKVTAPMAAANKRKVVPADPLKTYGVKSLPTDNMNAIMENQFQKQYISKKLIADEKFNQNIFDKKKFAA